MLEVLGVRFSNWDMGKTVTHLHEQIEHKKKGFHVVTANPEMVMQANRNKRFMGVLNEASLVTPDGIGIVVASRLLGEPLSNRVPGFDLILGLLSYREQLGKQTTIYAVGSTDEVIQEASRKISELYTKSVIVGTHHGYFQEGSEMESRLMADINDKAPDLLLAGLGCPKQEYFLYRLKQKGGDFTVGVGCGGTFDVLSGTVKRAPVLFQKTGFEWFYRLLKQPSRWRRQVNLVYFIQEVRRLKRKDKGKGRSFSD